MSDERTPKGASAEIALLRAEVEALRYKYDARGLYLEAANRDKAALRSRLEKAVLLVSAICGEMANGPLVGNRHPKGGWIITDAVGRWCRAFLAENTAPAGEEVKEG